MKAKKMKEIFLKRNEKMYFWQKPEGVILDDKYLGGTKNLYPCCLSWGRMASVSFVSFEKYELQMKKKFSKFF